MFSSHSEICFIERHDAKLVNMLTNMVQFRSCMCQRGFIKIFFDEAQNPIKTQVVIDLSGRNSIWPKLGLCNNYCTILGTTTSHLGGT